MVAFNRALQKAAKVVFKGFYVFGTVAFAFLLIILLCNVISRNLMGGAIAWVEEFSRFLFTWMMFLGISIGVYYKKHLGVDFIVAKYPPSVRKTISVFSDVLMISLFLVLTVFGFIYCKSTINMRSPIMNIRYGLVYLCVPLCGVFSTFYCFAGIMDKYFGEESKGGEEK